MRSLRSILCGPLKFDIAKIKGSSSNLYGLVGSRYGEEELRSPRDVTYYLKGLRNRFICSAVTNTTTECVGMPSAVAQVFMFRERKS
jgi:hypothetical protein